MPNLCCLPAHRFSSSRATFPAGSALNALKLTLCGAGSCERGYRVSQVSVSNLVATTWQFAPRFDSNCRAFHTPRISKLHNTALHTRIIPNGPLNFGHAIRRGCFLFCTGPCTRLSFNVS